MYAIRSYYAVSNSSVATLKKPKRHSLLVLSISLNLLIIKLSNSFVITSYSIHYTKLYEDVSNEEADRFLSEEANNLDNWDLHSVVGYRPNRALMYPSNYFHSKYPNTGWKEGRMVYVMFYR